MYDLHTCFLVKLHNYFNDDNLWLADRLQKFCAVFYWLLVAFVARFLWTWLVNGRLEPSCRQASQ